MTLQRFAEQNPNRLVTLYFENDFGKGQLTLPAQDAINPNASMRYFPEDGKSASDMGWAVPYWYAEEVIGWDSGPLA
jgi:hypothetical protein